MAVSTWDKLYPLKNYLPEKHREQRKLLKVGERFIRKFGNLVSTVWQTLAFIQKLIIEDKVVTQREVYYCLVNHFQSQSDFNNTLQGLPVVVQCKSQLYQYHSRGSSTITLYTQLTRDMCQ